MRTLTRTRRSPAPRYGRACDAIVAKLIEDAHDRALQILKENKFKLHELARYLYKKETITGEEFMNLSRARIR